MSEVALLSQNVPDVTKAALAWRWQLGSRRELTVLHFGERGRENALRIRRLLTTDARVRQLRDASELVAVDVTVLPSIQDSQVGRQVSSDAAHAAEGCPVRHSRIVLPHVFTFQPAHRIH